MRPRPSQRAGRNQGPLGGAPTFFGESGDHVGPALLLAVERHDLLLGRILQELREGGEPVVRLVEGRVLPDHRLLDHRAPEGLLVLALERLDGVDQLGHGLGLFLPQAPQQRRLLRVADEVLVEDELVAVRHEKIRGGGLDAEADDVSIVFTKLRDQRGEVRIARDQRERVDVRLPIGQIEGIDDHPDVRRVLAAVARLGDVDELDGPFVERALVLGEAIPVGVSPPHDDLALLEESLQDQLELELLVLRFLYAAGDVLEVHEHRQLPFSVHSKSFPPTAGQAPPESIIRLDPHRTRKLLRGVGYSGPMKPIDPALAHRVPPGQLLTEKWPVLTYGLTPRFDPARWTFRCFGLVDREATWTWPEFQGLPD